ncbi:MAG: hypothetical protein QNJ32_15620 [Xenococcaceae cyanobacterium MO_167.B27]|nr:hypothetical protein [Xenococcaceae cyanobacterium MO_167.B27]
MADINLSILNGRNGFVISGVNQNALLGDAVSTAGDINGDGIADIVIGARNSNSNAGEVYVILGDEADFPANFSVSDLDGNNGFRISGLADNDRLGISVSSAGDFNGDGTDDLIIGANGRNNDTGASYVIFGEDQGFPSSLDLSDLDNNDGFVINGLIEGDLFGTSVSSAGDVNGDGFDDVIIGTPYGYNNQNLGAGASYVIFGSNESFSNFDLASLDGSNGFAINGVEELDNTGFSVSSAGDFNGDGFDDLMIGADFAAAGDRTGAGATYIVFGSNDNFSPSVDLSSLDGNNGFRINGVAAGDGGGVSVAKVGDFNGDDFDDIVIGASGADVGDRSNAGQAYVVFGNNGSFDPTLELSDLNGTNGFTINGIATDDLLGISVSGAGDVNLDGIEDIVLGARGGNDNPGASYVIFGSNNDFSAVLELADLTPNQGFTITTDNTDSLLGEAVSGAGDVNNDGIDDLLVGAPQADPDGTTDAGESYVIFGQSDLVLGDVDKDGAYTQADVYGISRFAAGLDTEFSAYAGINPLLVADVNSDGVISAFDASVVASVINGVESPFISPIPTP